MLCNCTSLKFAPATAGQLYCIVFDPALLDMVQIMAFPFAHVGVNHWTHALAVWGLLVAFHPAILTVLHTSHSAFNINGALLHRVIVHHCCEGISDEDVRALDPLKMRSAGAVT